MQLHVFGIIKVPAKYSIASLFYSQIEIIATSGENIEETEKFPNENKNNDNLTELKDISESNENNDNNEAQERVEIPNPIDEMNRIEAEREEAQKQENENINAERFYYSQLDEYGKIIYDKLYDNMDELKTGEYTADFDTTFDELLHHDNGSEILNNSFQLAINALTFDNPELFYIDITKINLITEKITRSFSTTYKISIGGYGRIYLSDDFSNIDSVKQNILSNTGDDVVENLRIVHDYLIDTISYDADMGRNVYNIYGALISQSAVCEGYARAYKEILDEMGVPCIIACGTAKNNEGNLESHAWNYVLVDGKWYAIDVTWDDPIIQGNGSLNDRDRYRYFLIGSDQFFVNHFEDGNIAAEYQFEYPTLSRLSY